MWRPQLTVCVFGKECCGFKGKAVFQRWGGERKGKGKVKDACGVGRTGKKKDGGWGMGRRKPDTGH